MECSVMEPIPFNTTHLTNQFSIPSFNRMEHNNDIITTLSLLFIPQFLLLLLFASTSILRLFAALHSSPL